VDELTRDEIKSLAERTEGPCVSIYMPTHRAGPDIQQDPIRLRNQLSDSERRLTASGMRGPQARALVAPADELVPRHRFWQHQSDGLAVFLAPDFFRYFHLPMRVVELTVTGNRFHLKPLMPMLGPEGEFYILALSQNQVRLLEGTRYHVNEVNLERVPKSLSEALKYDDPEAQLQFHTSSATPGGRGDRPAMFHGHGTGHDDARSNVLRYFHKVDAGLREWLAGRQAPLVLAGVEYLHPLYREANTYPHLLEDGLPGNPDDLRPEELHIEAWQIVQPYFAEAQEASAARFRRLAGAGSPLASGDLAEIVAAAHYGRVETLFVTVGEQQWGSFDPETAELVKRDSPEADSQDLLDLAAVQTFLNGGAVYALEAADMPNGAPIAAVFRY
jgi:hypothetical protein